MNKQMGFTGYDNDLHRKAKNFRQKEVSAWTQIELCCGPRFMATRLGIPRCPKCAALEKSIGIPQAKEN